MNSITLTAPAKVNLFLKVLNKRKDGYHNIVTIFERISLADEIRISKAPRGIQIYSNKFITARPKDNLVYKAAELILKYIRGNKGKEKGIEGRGGGLSGRDKKPRGVEIRVKKRIPIAAGLGGGSSDAASVLLGINRLYNMKLPEKELIRLASRLGADVPFFTLKSPFAIARGLGERLTKVKLRFPLWHVIVYHGQKASTKEMYEAFDASTNCLTRDFCDDKITPYSVRSMDFNTLEAMLYNSLEEIVSVKLPVTGSILERLAYSTGRKSIITGSGPGVFCLCATRKEAIEAKDKFMASVPAEDKKGWQVFIAKTQV